VSDRSDSFDLFAAAIVARRGILRADWRRRAREIRNDLLDLNLAIAMLSDIHLRIPVAQLVGANPPMRVIESYAEFLSALVNTCQFVQNALIAGDLTSRTETRVPVWSSEISVWTKRDIAREVFDASRVFWRNPPPPETASSAWPDHAVWAPDVFIDQRQFTEWTNETGLESSKTPVVDLANTCSSSPAHARTPLLSLPGEPAITKVASRRSRVRSDVLEPVIALAQTMTQHPDDAQCVWLALVELAERKEPPRPLLGYVEGEGIKYKKQYGKASDRIEFFTKENLQDRFRRRANRR